MAEVARKVFCRGGSDKTSVLVWQEWQEKCFCVVGVTILPPLAAINSEQNLRGFYQRQSQLTGGQVLGPTLLPPAGVRIPVKTSTQG